jgi:effector-binding domain-containing protein
MVDLCSGDSVSHAVNRNTVSVIKIKICVRIQIKRIPCFLTETLDKVRANDICTFISMFFIKTVESLRKKKRTTIQKCKASVYHMLLYWEYIVAFQKFLQYIIV